VLKADDARWCATLEELHVAGLARYGSTRSIFTLRRVRADSIIASVTSTTRSPSRPVANGWSPVAAARWKSSMWAGSSIPAEMNQILRGLLPKM